MGCCGKREKFGDLHNEQKWEYVNLDDFKGGWASGFGYAYLLIMAVVSISIYVVDSFVAVNLLAFNKWAGQIQPAIPFEISRWIFAGCIILSFILLIERWIRAVKVMKQGGVAKSYLDPLAVRVQSIRWGNARGFRRFLVFAQLTKSRKGADYVALFAYFSFEAAIRIIFAEGPRVVINGITLYSVTRLNLIPVGDHAGPEGRSPVEQFFVNIGEMADKDKLQAAVLFGMLWTCLIWILAAFSLAASVIMYLLFLWHHIPSEAGGLKNYCRIKINKRMWRVVREKVKESVKKEDEIRARQEARAAATGLKKQPTVPDITPLGEPKIPTISRTNTLGTLPEYEPNQPGRRESSDSFDHPPMPTGRPGGPHRIMTHQSDASTTSFSSNAPLMNSASDMGYSDGPFGRPMPPNRAMTGTPRSMAPSRPGTAQEGPSYPLEPLARPGTAMSNGPRRVSDESMGGFGMDRSMGARTPSWDRPGDMGRRPPPNNYFPPIQEAQSGRNSPAMGGPPRRFSPPQQPLSRGPIDRPYTPSQPSLPSIGPDRSYTPVNGPPRSFTPVNGPPRGPPGRSFTDGGPPHGPPERSFTPIGGPPLARVQTASDIGGGYRAFTPEPAPMDGRGPASNVYGAYRPGPNGRPSQGPGYPADRVPPRRQSSEVRDILDSY